MRGHKNAALQFSTSLVVSSPGSLFTMSATRKVPLAITTILLASHASSFILTAPVRSHLPRVQFSNGDAGGPTEFPVLSPLVPESESIASVQEERQILLPFQIEQQVDLPPTTKQSFGQTILDSWKGMRKNVTKTLQALRPSQKFQARVFGFAVIAASITSVFIPRIRLLPLLQTWISTRGFQGLAALGRSITYAWGLFVAYPNMLDRRASERKARDKERTIHIRRQHLTRMAAEITRLRQELATIEAEIRSFRREIIAMKAYYTNKSTKEDQGDDMNSSNREVEEAIGVEMAHLTQLRSDTKAALAAARQAWTEVRTESPPEAWHDDPLLMGL